MRKLKERIRLSKRRMKSNDERPGKILKLRKKSKRQVTKTV